ncbi:TPA: hypothetical protein N0F65_010837 [Lagenidium giganteum]|uniref:Protein kinase domain-containing protein n=1 Tax=Lagenidium giganteum TaxID=4803 RepID=A0AAV2Z5Z6_9STRA|nr:TPA: hypothetical protein N0F65_010837 [Lagenidium giganteum]
MVLRWLVTASAVAVAVASLSLHAHAAPCSSLKDTILTSKGCPSQCRSAPCVYYAPTTECRDLQLSGPCYTGNDTTVPTVADACDVSYQCLSQVVVSQKQVWLVISDTSLNQQFTVVPFTSIKDITYDSTAVAVQVFGNADNEKGKVKDIKLDDSFVKTPKAITMFIANNMNLRAYLADRELPTSWEIIIFSNANLNKVPATWSKLGAVTKLDLSMNYLTEFPDEKSDMFSALKTLKSLNLSSNDISEFNAKYPALTSLDLSFNPKISKIPDMVFDSDGITELLMRGCNLTNLQLTSDQHTRLSQMKNFDAAPTFTSCPSGYGDKDLRGYKVCVKGAASSSSKSGSSNTLAIALGSAAGVLVLCGIGFFFYRRNKKKSDDYYVDTVGKPGEHTYTGGEFTGGMAGTDTFGSSSIWNDPDLLAVRVEYKDIELVKLLARGGFGEVWLGLYMNENSGAKLSDFGISRNRSVEETMTAGVGTSRWIAPEVILGGHYTEFADVYSFGVVLSELDTCKTPYHDAVNTNGAKMQDVTILQLVSAGKLQPSFSPSSPPSIVQLARACLSFDPAERPSAIHISYELRKILRDELSSK